jgi:hypothetical protein
MAPFGLVCSRDCWFVFDLQWLLQGRSTREANLPLNRGRERLCEQAHVPKTFFCKVAVRFLNTEVENMDITQTTPSTSVTSKRLLEFGFGFAPALIIDAAVKYYIFDAVDHGPKTLKEIH